ncbi:hypothetical protein GCM10010274_05440 [Streptomyces lavendofoliae]|uniref:Uncharacterized protein n=1 Tax=Streptomyces lavendofoliae TaxID=67314 RepID=A0A918HU54_9ACTN|nr:hypothetical protein GCM10010274_05440 [Streptomyces lavendofoliae]
MPSLAAAPGDGVRSARRSPEGVEPGRVATGDAAAVHAPGAGRAVVAARAATARRARRRVAPGSSVTEKQLQPPVRLARMAILPVH